MKSFCREEYFPNLSNLLRKPLGKSEKTITQKYHPVVRNAFGKGAWKSERYFLGVKVVRRRKKHKFPIIFLDFLSYRRWIIYNITSKWTRATGVRILNQYELSLTVTARHLFIVVLWTGYCPIEIRYHLQIVIIVKTVTAPYFSITFNLPGPSLNIFLIFSLVSSSRSMIAFLNFRLICQTQ